MITEDYVSFEIAKLMEEKGFDWDESPFYSEQDRDEWRQNNNYTIPNTSYNHDLPFDSETITLIAPHVSLQMAMKWLRKIHNIHIEVNLSFSEDPIKYPPFYYVYILDSKSGNSVIDQAARIDGLNPLVDVDNVPRNFNTYEEACEAAIKYCLENLI